MNSVLIAFSLAGAAAAQIVAGSVSMAPYSQVYGTTDAADNHAAAPSATSGGYNSAPASQYTQPPATDGGYSAMPYSSFMSGGYKSMNCGYGYTKGSDGSCNPLSWVSTASRLCFRTSANAACASISGRLRDATKRSSSTTSE